MNKELEQKLHNLEFSDKETTIYLAGVSLGSFSISELAIEANLKRPICYIIAHELEKRGLFSLLPNKKKKLFRAESIEVLKKSYEQKIHSVESILSSIENIFGSRKIGNPTVRMYTGMSGIQNVGRQVLESKEKKFYFIGSAENAIKAAGDVFTQYYANTLKNKNFQSYGIRINRDFDYSLFNRPNNEVCYAPEGFTMKDNILIFDDKVAIFTDGDTPYAIVFQSTSLVDSMISMFKSIQSISDKI